MSVFYLYTDEQSFWEAFSKPNPSGEICHLKWNEICKKAKDIRKDKDTNDCRDAKKEYVGKRFDEIFGYRKSSKWIVMKSKADIARKYREIKGEPRPWDDQVYNRP